MSSGAVEGSHVETSVDGRILTIRLDRPEKKNALSVAMYAAMVEAIRHAEAEPGIRVILIRAAAVDCFTSGNDVMDFMVNPPTDASSPVVQFLSVISEARKPIVAAVGGSAIGIGVTMLLHCDLVYAGENANFRMPFVNLGLCPEAGSSLLLPRVAGYLRAAELILLGEFFDAEKAREAGIVTAVVPDERLYAVARERAEQVAALPPAAVQKSKMLLKRDTQEGVREAIIEEGRHFMTQLRSPEFAEAVQAVLQHREPDFSGIE